ncbi:sulfate/molybdate ABC transporter ATP-binding protein [Halalkalibacterium ligniniphilum]|uniref:sulfate/molybdate ABC transporter ATP-binding protein n=1 Tax=Halalkalibacterium ligniniphilum TaxID=1134413 RepID=UPI00034C9AE6|nr:ATP-binding cassette domain-containing protein [Halalkalibacterium ligniniphilum]
MDIQVKGLHKYFGDFHAIKGVDFQIKEGNLVGLLGPSGGGKTSILRMLAGLEHPTEGDIYLDHKLANDLPTQKREIGFVFQNYALFKHMTVFENVAYGLRVKKAKKEEIDQSVHELLRLMGLAGTEKKYPHQLSGGQKQRVAFARALAPRPRLLLLDEPFAAIDAKVRKELRVWLRNVITEFGITTIFVTHDQDEAVEVADEILIINQGKVEQQGAPWDIYHHPSSVFVAGFIGESTIVEKPTTLVGFDRLALLQQQEDSLHQHTIFIRPEWIEVRPSEVTVNKFAGQSGVVKHLHFRGDSWYVEVTVGDLDLVTYSSIQEKQFQIGEEVNVLIHQLSIFTNTGNEILENELKDTPLPYHI